jgi:metal-dependent hydrolase (beta-lactamase superfamily II)
MDKLSLKKLNYDELKELEEFALKHGFSLTNQPNGGISFSPRGTDNFYKNTYLSLDWDLTLRTHKFMSFKELDKYLGVKVSLDWVKKFLVFRSEMAMKDTNEIEEKNKKIKEENKKTEAENKLILIEKNKKIIEENERNLPYDAEENLDKQRKIEEDRPLYRPIFTQSVSLDDYDNHGPSSDNWDSANWEEHMGGPEDPIDA